MKTTVISSNMSIEKSEFTVEATRAAFAEHTDSLQRAHHIGQKLMKKYGWELSNEKKFRVNNTEFQRMLPVCYWVIWRIDFLQRKHNDVLANNKC